MIYKKIGASINTLFFAVGTYDRQEIISVFFHFPETDPTNLRERLSGSWKRGRHFS